MKGKIQEKIVKLRDLSEYTAKVIEDAEAEILQIFSEKNYDMTRFDTLIKYNEIKYCFNSLFMPENDDFKKPEEGPVCSRLDLEELIIENNKRLITTNNR